MKQQEIIKRARKHALLFIKRNATVRSVAEETGFSKTTVHLDLYRIQQDYPDLFGKVQEKINFHNQVKSIRGGEATRKKKEKKKK